MTKYDHIKWAKNRSTGITDGVPDESHSQRAGMYDHFNCVKSHNQKYWYKVCQMKVTA